MHDRGVNSTRRRLVSGGAFGLLAVIGLVMPSAFVVETAGPAIDVTGKYDGTQLVKLSGAATYSTSTKLFMTTVSSYGTADNGVPSAQVFASLFSRDMQSVPVRALYSKDESSGDVDRRNAALMTDSQDTAAVVALGKAGRTVKNETGGRRSAEGLARGRKTLEGRRADFDFGRRQDHEA